MSAIRIGVDAEIKDWLKKKRDKRIADAEFERELAEHRRKAAATPDQVQKAVKQALKKQRRSSRGNTQGCGCLLMVLGLILCFIFLPIGGLTLIAGFIILIIGLLL